MQGNLVTELEAGYGQTAEVRFEDGSVELVKTWDVIYCDGRPIGTGCVVVRDISGTLRFEQLNCE